MKISTYADRLTAYNSELAAYEKELAEALDYNGLERPLGAPNKRLPLRPSPPLMYPEDL